MKFTDTNIDENLLKALAKMGFTDMTPVQEQTYPLIHAGKDICGLAETGSGKTAACAIPMIEKIDPGKSAIQGLVIVPTRELCIQYVDEIGNLAEYTHVKPFAIYGGFSKEIQMAKINHEVHVLVATPGRLIDLIYDGVIDFTSIKVVILDEADELLKEGFLDDIKFILSCIRTEHQTLLFSATMPNDIKELAKEYFRDPVEISLINKQASPKSLTHCFKYVNPKDKLKELKTLFDKEDVNQAIIFCNSRQGVDQLHRDLRRQVGNVDYIHAGLAQDKRSSLFRQFKTKKIKILIATDVAGRGLDFSQVTHVINYDYPRSNEQYMHRTGRSGRMGREGKAITFISKRDLHNLRKLFNVKKIDAYWLGKNPLDPNAPDKPLPDRKKSGIGKKQHGSHYSKKGKRPGNKPGHTDNRKPDNRKPDNRKPDNRKPDSRKPVGKPANKKKTSQQNSNQSGQIYIQKRKSKSGKPANQQNRMKPSNQKSHPRKQNQPGQNEQQNRNKQQSKGQQTPRPQKPKQQQPNQGNRQAPKKQQQKPGFFKRLFSKKEKSDS